MPVLTYDKNMLQKPPSIPHTPGVYFFKKGMTTLYVGKAGDLQKRLSGYWRKNSGAKVESLLAEANHVEWRELETEVDALIKEAEHIKNYIPKYNIVLRDDKSYFYVGITKEAFPKIFAAHHPERHKPSATRNLPSADYIGPFTSGTTLKLVLRFLRKIFPYCTCFKPHKRPCLNAEIGRCLGYCCTAMNNESRIMNHEWEIKKEEYRKNIQNIVAILNGKKKRILVQLKREMKDLATLQQFEKAASCRNQIEGLKNIFLHTATLDRQKILRAKRNWTHIRQILQATLGAAEDIRRVEGYDISNISGADSTGSMVVFINGYPKKAEYRKFKIKTVAGPNDFAMMQEVLMRRFQHPEWEYPDLILIDGGKPQLNIALRALETIQKELGIKKEILIAGLAKREEELYIPGYTVPVLLRTLPRDTEFFLEHVRNESHRFAKKYHHKLREMSYRRK